MKFPKHLLTAPCLALLVLSIAYMATPDATWLDALWLALLVCLVGWVEEYKVRLVWQTPPLFQCAGLYLLVGRKRYRLIKVGLL